MVDDDPDKPCRSITSLEKGTYRIRRGVDGGFYVWGIVLAMAK